MRPDGVLIGRIVHIEAAMPGGARFRAAMTNEERRGFENLMLMCGTHHDVIDADVVTWTVDRLRDVKANHETTYATAVDQLRETIGDVTEGTAWRSASNLGRLTSLDSLTDQEVAVSIQTTDDLARRLAAVPLAARSLLALIVKRGEVVDRASGEVAIPAWLLEEIANCSRGDLYRQINVLEHAGFGFIDEPYEAPTEVVVRSTPPEVGWPVFAELKELALEDPSVVHRMIVDLDLTALDR